MDRALVHTEIESASSSNRMRWEFNIPFELIPEGFIAQLDECPFTYEEYLDHSQLMNELPSYWNIALIEQETSLIKGFFWGVLDPLEKTILILHATKHPELFDIRGEFLEDGITVLKRFAQRLGIHRIFWVTRKWKAFQRKLDGVISVNEKARIVEVL